VRIYLAGPPGADEYRLRAAELVRAGGGVPVDPFRRDFRGRTEGHEREIVEGDLADIDTSDAVLAAFTEPDEGTAMEAWYAHSRGKPLVAWTGGAWKHPWTVYVARSVHEQLEDAVDAALVEPPPRSDSRVIAQVRTEEPREHQNTRVRLASAADASVFGRLLHAFNAEFGASTPDAELIAERAEPLIETGEVTVLFAGAGPGGFAQLRFRTSVYTGVLDAYLEELYIVPERRGRGVGRALLEAAMEHARQRGAARIDLNTSVNDIAARALYESAGFTDREGGPEGPQMLYYERDL
jgi:ribosomal protein S18 acetylase RimI-like enzyme